MMRTLSSDSEFSFPSPSKTKRDWPVFPAVIASVLFLSIRFQLTSQVWLLNLLCLLSAYAIAQCGLIFAQNWQAFNHASLRWLVSGLGIFLATLAAVWLQKTLWPAMLTPHAVWLMPAICLLFLLAAILPSAIRLEIARKSAEQLQLATEEYARERQLLEARLAALQAQIEPHFLFNTLATTRALLKQDTGKAEQMLQHLIAYLQAALPDMREALTRVGQELDRAEAYLEIMRIRLAERLTFSIDATAAARSCQIPPLMLMTLVENAIKHGVEPKPGRSHVAMRAHCEGGYLQIEVEDDGAGFQHELGNGVGLLNIQERLSTMFGAHAELSLMPGERSGVLATLRLPALAESQIA